MMRDESADASRGFARNTRSMVRAGGSRDGRGDGASGDAHRGVDPVIFRVSAQHERADPDVHQPDEEVRGAHPVGLEVLALGADDLERATQTILFGGVAKARRALQAARGGRSGRGRHADVCEMPMNRLKRQVPR